MDASDHDLLQNYVRRRSEEAFAAVVSRYADLVYSAALRQVRGAHLAEEVAQQVFVELARHAAHMKPDTLLVAWLHAVTRRRAIDVVRSEARRQQREQISLDLAEANSSASDADWSRVAPLLDDALQSIPASERDAVLLRYFENKSLREVGATLGISDDAAQKRVHRALDRLRAHFARRRIPLGAAGLATLLSTQAVQAAPAGLAVSLSSAVFLAAGTGAGVGLVAVTKTIAMTTLQKSLVAGTLALGLGFGVYEVRQTSRLQDRLAAAEQTAAQTRLTTARRLAALTDENARLRAEADRLRAEALSASQARAADAASAQDPSLRAMADWLERVQTLKARIKARPETAIPEMQWLNEEDWLAAAKNNPLSDEEEFRHAASQLRSRAENVFSNKAFPALQRYLKANGNKFPTDLAQLQPFFDAPVDPAILERWEIKPAKELPGIGVGGDWVITQKAAVDEELDQRTGIGARGYGSSGGGFNPDTAHLQAVGKAYLAANPGRQTTRMEDLLPYATTPQQKAAIQKVLAAQKSGAK